MRRSPAFFATALFAGFLPLALPLTVRAQDTAAVTNSFSARIDRIATEEIHAGRTPGIAIGLVEDGLLVYARGFGSANLARHTPMTAETEFYAGDVTMEFTASAVLLLAQSGKLKLDDTVGKYVPEFKLGSNITIAQLLTQTSGLPGYAGLTTVSTDPTKSIKLVDLLAAVDTLKPAASPGTAYANNPLNYMLAGLIVERVSGITLSDYLEQNIFIPLVMDHSFIAGDNGISPTHAIGYMRTPRGFPPAPVWDPAWLDGASGLVSSIDDLAKWEIGMPVLLRVDAVRTMFTPASNVGPTRYGMGWVIDRRGGKAFVWSNGQIPGYRAFVAMLPAQHIGVIVFSNADSPNGSISIPEEIGARILDLVEPPASARLDNAIVARAKEWLTRLASRRIDRTELTPSFSAFLTDALIARENFAALGRLQAIVPLSSTTESNGDTLYVFLVRYPRAQYHYDFEVATNGKIDGIRLGS